MIKQPAKSKRIFDLLTKTAVDSAAWNIEEIKAPKGQILAFLNAHAITTSSWNIEFYKTLMQSNYLLRDGIGIKIALKLFGLPVGENLNGTDLITRILPLVTDKKIAIYGASMNALNATQSKLQANGITNIIDLQHGFHDAQFYADACTAQKPDVIILCMGMPKQEHVATELLKHHPDLLVICGGGWADFYSGTKKRAPEWVRKLSMEWIYRLLLEPKRLGKRYSVDVIYFFYLVFMARLIVGKK